MAAKTSECLFLGSIVPTINIVGHRAISLRKEAKRGGVGKLRQLDERSQPIGITRTAKCRGALNLDRIAALSAFSVELDTQKKPSASVAVTLNQLKKRTEVARENKWG